MSVHALIHVHQDSLGLASSHKPKSVTIGQFRIRTKEFNVVNHIGTGVTQYPATMGNSLAAQHKRC